MCLESRRDMDDATIKIVKQIIPAKERRGEGEGKEDKRAA